jgi:hypothetical protein
VEGSFEAGDYQVYVGGASRGTAIAYRLLIASSREVVLGNVGYAQAAAIAGQPIFRARLSVRSQTGDVFRVGDSCDVEQSAVGNGSMVFVWTILCGDLVAYRRA